MIMVMTRMMIIIIKVEELLVPWSDPQRRDSQSLEEEHKLQRPGGENWFYAADGDNGAYNMVIVMVVVRTVKTMVLSQLMYLVIPCMLVGFPKQDVVPHSTGLLKFKRTHCVSKNRKID